MLLTVGWLVQTLEWGTSDAQTGEDCQSCDLSSAEPRYHELITGFTFTV